LQPPAWINRLSRHDVRGPDSQHLGTISGGGGGGQGVGQEGEEGPHDLGQYLMGEAGFAEWQAIRRAERQRGEFWSWGLLHCV
jgi:hypothetical protein